jgi:hypothetical protein
MNAPSLYNVYANPFLLWMNIAFKTGETLMASAWVIGHRSGRMALAGSSPGVSDRREFARMGTEKIFASAESAQAVANNLIKLNQQLGVLALKQLLTGGLATISLASTSTPLQAHNRGSAFVRETMNNAAAAGSRISHSAARVIDDGLQPVHSRATKNAKRLSRR